MPATPARLRAALHFLIGLAAAYASLFCLCGPARADRLVILHTNDIHSHLEPFDDFRGGQHHPRSGGAATRAALIRAERSGAALSLILDAGDVFQGTPYFNFYHGRLDYDIMGMTGYDAGCLGNHDLDDGYRHFQAVRPLARFPILSANVEVPSDADTTHVQLLCQPDTLFLRGGHRIGIFGLTTEDLLTITDRRRNPGLRVLPAVPAAREEVRKLRSQGADLVVALTHLGVHEDSILAQQVGGIDLVIGGHSHTFLDTMSIVPHPEMKNGWGGTGIVQAGRYGVVLGRIDVDFPDRPSPVGSGEVASQAPPRAAHYRLIPVDSTTTPDSAIAAYLRPYREGVDSAMSAVVGQAAGDFAKDADAHRETALGNLVADALRSSARADVGLENWGGIRAPLPRGPIRVNDIYTMLPFDNEVVRVELKGSDLRDLFDFISRQNLLRGRGQISGAAFLETPAGAESVTVVGAPLDLARTYTVGTTDFLLQGGDGFIMLARGRNVVTLGIFLRDAMITYVKARHTLTPVLDGRLRPR